MKPPSSHKHLAAQPTALEARHFAAAYALFRVCNMRNLHMMLPPTYKKLWKEDFTDLKNADTKEGKGWMYEADPFLAKQERETAAAEQEKKRKEREKAQAKEKETAVDLGVGSSGENRGKRIWSQAPKVDLGNRIRRELEELLRQHTIWNPYRFRRLSAKLLLKSSSVWASDAVMLKRLPPPVETGKRFLSGFSSTSRRMTSRGGVCPRDIPPV